MRMEKSEAINELATALAKAQGEISNATKNATNQHFKSNYADLSEVLNVVRPVFSAHGLSLSQHPSFDGELLTVETLIAHTSGQWMLSAISSPLGKKDAQGIGSATTYCRRYGLAAIAGIAQDDDDGNAASSGNGKSQHKPTEQKQHVPEITPDQETMVSDWKTQCLDAHNKQGIEGFRAWFAENADTIHRDCGLAGKNMVIAYCKGLTQK